MNQEIRRNSYYIYILLFFVVSNFLIVGFKFFFFSDHGENLNPVSFSTQSVTNNFEKEKVSTLSSTSEMIEAFEESDFLLDDFFSNTSTSLIVFSSFPDDFNSMEPIEMKKELFKKVMINIIYIENKKILELRKRILSWWTKTDGEEVSKDYWPEWLKEISRTYNHNNNNIGNLLIKVDIIPISLALSQSIIESGWGSSRYARQGNAFFGQRTLDEDNSMTPLNQNSDAPIYIKKFRNLSESVESYIMNLNVHDAYKDFRENRKNMRMNGESIKGEILVNYLENYSERKTQYIDDVKEIIVTNGFNEFDNVFSKQSGKNF